MFALRQGMMVFESENQLYEIKKNSWNTALETLDDVVMQALDKSENQQESMTLRWVLDEISKLIK